MLEHTQSTSTAALSIGRSPSELYESWQQPQVRAKIADHYLDRIVPTNFAPNESMTWVSSESENVHYRGHIEFSQAPADYGTEVRLTLEPLDDPSLLQKLKVDSAEEVARTLATKTLRHFKSLMETGEVPTLKANPSTRNNSDEK